MAIESTQPRPVLVHGNPETDAIWSPLRSSLSARGVMNVVCLTPPGFGRPLPSGFDATADAYHGWLVDELITLGAPDHPVDLVGHDWGAGHVLRVAADRPDLIRSWAADIGGLLHPDYEWHDAAQGWRTEGVGEEMVQSMASLATADLAATYTTLGMTAEIARSCAEAMGDDMGRAILALYRSAPEAMLRALGDRLVATQSSGGGAPGAIIGAVGDDYVPIHLGRAVSRRIREAGGNVVDLTIEDAAHWWMIEQPVPAAEALLDFWSGVRRRTSV